MILKIFILVFCSCFGISFTQSSCRTPNGEISYCVSIYECHVFLDVLKEGTLTPQITNFLRESRCEDGNVTKVCCGSFYNYENTANRAGNVGKSSNEQSSNEECGKFYGDKYAGKTNELKINEYPWTALIEYKNNEGSTGHHCGAVLINKDYVLTAAHCVDGSFLSKVGNAFQVRLGEYNRRNERDCVSITNGTYACFDNHQNIKINKIFVHPLYKYNNGSYSDDIAIIKLAKSVVVNDFIRPVCLTTPESITLAGDEYSVAGWGINENNEGQMEKHLIKTLVLNNEQCNRVSSENINFSPFQFCAVKSGTQEKYQYCGDTGGAIVKQVTDQNNGISFELQGIESYSFNENRDNKNYIIVYTKMSEYINWIREEIRL